ncbi:M50 family metallopeptidase [Cognatiyoonia sp. IB215446]|uniref:M50 family metallopeptidase n=1 Tax=Cognatiyoonia sp. IB215446 TaxID=3097355 RepID=UPI002A103994|nr:M50 family metallopeptidase [Cognatiyoonia sp. IB215446]MDX8350021.1 M50 family metallopeptidase [Cognatiyoonia sp. IB215446]
MTYLKGHWQLLLLTVLVFALWQTPVVIPLKILIVFFHELSHAAATILTGGEVISLSVSADQGGVVWSRGGNRFLTLTAGYLGSLLIGVGLLVAATRSKADRAIMAACGVVMLVVAGLYIRDFFALSFAIGIGVAMLLMSRFLGHAANDLALRVMGLTSMIYVPYDIFSDTIARSNLRSDARMLAEEFGGTTMMWGGLWLVLSLVVIGACLLRGLGPNSNLVFKRK